MNSGFFKAWITFTVDGKFISDKKCINDTKKAERPETIGGERAKSYLAVLSYD